MSSPAWTELFAFLFSGPISAQPSAFGLDVCRIAVLRTTGVNMSFLFCLPDFLPLWDIRLLRNPSIDLREHALFTLRNVLHGNAENQAIVDAIKPMGSWDENGILRDTPGTRK